MPNNIFNYMKKTIRNEILFVSPNNIEHLEEILILYLEILKFTIIKLLIKMRNYSQIIYIYLTYNDLETNKKGTRMYFQK